MDIPGSRANGGASILLNPGASVLLDQRPQSFIDPTIRAEGGEPGSHSGHEQELSVRETATAPAGATAEHLVREGEQARHRISPRCETALCVTGGSLLLAAGLSSCVVSCMAFAGTPALSNVTCAAIPGLCLGGGFGISTGSFMMASQVGYSHRTPTTLTPPAEQTMERSSPSAALVVNPDDTLSLACVPPSALNVSQPAQS